MKKKILIGSIIAVALLTLVSFSSVVGYNSVKSDNRIISPLFGVRTKRANDKKQDATASDYINKGKSLNILLPRRNDKVELIDKLIERLNVMGDVEFENLLLLFEGRLPKDVINNLVKKSLINALMEIKNKPYILNKLIINFNVFDEKEKPIFPTIGEPWYPGCISGVFLNIIFTVLYEILVFIIFILAAIIPTSGWQCGDFI